MKKYFLDELIVATINNKNSNTNIKFIYEKYWSYSREEICCKEIFSREFILYKNLCNESILIENLSNCFPNLDLNRKYTIKDILLLYNELNRNEFFQNTNIQKKNEFTK